MHTQLSSHVAMQDKVMSNLSRIFHFRKNVSYLLTFVSRNIAKRHSLFNTDMSLEILMLYEYWTAENTYSLL
jgi:hypothetical protein